MSTAPSEASSRAVREGVRIAAGIVVTLLLFVIAVSLAYLAFSNGTAGASKLSANLLLHFGMVLLMAGLFPLSALAFGWLEVPRIIEQVERDCLLLGTDLPRDRSGNPIVAGRWSMTSYVLHYIPAVIATFIGIALLTRKPDDYFGANTLQAMRFGFLGAYVYCLNLIYRRYTTLDLQPHVYLYCSAGLIAGMVFNYVAFEAIDNIAAYNSRPVVQAAPADASGQAGATAGGTTDPSTADDQRLAAADADSEMPFTGIGAALAAILSFSLGYFPNLAIRWFRRLSHAAVHEGVRRSEALPLALIDGISDLHETRLRDEGIDNIQNLATANIRDLVVKTPFSAQQIVEWIDQAVLYLYLDPTEIASFRRAGARCVTDFGDLWSGFCVRYVVQPDGTFKRLPISHTAGSQTDFDSRRKALAQHLQTTEERLDALYTATEQGPNMHFVRTYWTNVHDMAALARASLVKQVCGRVGCALRNSERDGAILTPTDILKQVVTTLMVEAESQSTDKPTLDMTAGSLFGQAWLNRLLGNIQEARRLYEQCIKDFPEDPAAFNDFAWLVLQSLRDATLYEQARKHALAAVEMARKSNSKNTLPGYLDTLALANIRLKEPDEALKALKEARLLWADLNRGDQPKFLETLLAAAEEFLAQEKNAEAFGALNDLLDAGYADNATEKRAKELHDKVSRAMLSSAQSLATNGKKKEAGEMAGLIIASRHSDAATADRARKLVAEWDGTTSA